MRYEDQDRQSENVEDRRGQGGGGFPFPGGRGGGIRIPIGGRGGMSLTTMIIMGVILWMLGFNPFEVLLGQNGINIPGMPGMPSTETTSRGDRTSFDIPGLPKQGGEEKVPKANDEMKVFISRVLADTEDVWTRLFQTAGRRYEAPRLVLFTGSTRTACGQGMAAMGPFYCPEDQKVYIDLNFYDELKRRFDAPGDFAQAYVIAHEVGHHVQTLLGIADKVQAAKAQSSEREGNRIQVMMELQADCLAGVWANNLNQKVKTRIEPGDIDEALNAAHQIGDDILQKRTQGRVVPDAFTHGSAEQRMRWFTTGYETGNLKSCDTFSAKSL